MCNVVNLHQVLNNTADILLNNKNIYLNKDICIQKRHKLCPPPLPNVGPRVTPLFLPNH